MIAFAEAFRPLGAATLFDIRFVSLPATLGLIMLMLTKGAAIGVRALYVVVLVLGASLVLFFLGHPVLGAEGSTAVSSTIVDADPFFIVFAICFPAFTGMTAGVGLSGDLANPRKSIPNGMSYLLLDHPDWYHAEISVFAALPRDQLDELRALQGADTRGACRCRRRTSGSCRLTTRRRTESW